MKIEGDLKNRSGAVVDYPLLELGKRMQFYCKDVLHRS